MPRHYPKHLPLDDHQLIAAQLALIKNVLMAMQEHLRSIYPMHDPIMERLYKLWRSGSPIETLRSKLDDAFYAEGHTGPSPYYPAPRPLLERTAP